MNPKLVVLLLLVAGSRLLGPATAQAQDSNKVAGVGFILGEPFGGSFKTFFDGPFAIDAAVGWEPWDGGHSAPHSAPACS